MKDQITLVQRYVDDVSVPVEFNQMIDAVGGAVIAEVHVIGSYFLTTVNAVGFTTVASKSGSKLSVMCDFSNIPPGASYSIVFKTLEHGVLAKSNLVVYGEDAFSFAGSFTFVSDPIALTAAIDSGDGQTVWQGVVGDIVFTINAGDDDFTVSGVPAGATFDKPSRTLSGVTYASLSSGVNVIPITFTGQNGYTGSAPVDVTVTKSTRSDIDDVVTPANIKGWWRVSEGRTDDGNVISQVNGKHLGGENMTQTTVADRPFLTLINGVVAASFDYAKLDSILAANLSPPFHLFFVVESTTIRGALNTFWGIDTSNYLYLTTTFGRFQETISGSAKLLILTSDEQLKEIGEKPFIYEYYVDASGNWEIRVDGGESVLASGTGASTDARPFASNFSLGAWYSNKAISLEGKMGEAIFYSGTLTTDERQDIEGILAYLYSLQDNLAVAHPHKTIPPLL